MKSRWLDLDRTLAAIHSLEEPPAAAPPGREGSWRDQLLTGLGVLEAATNEEYDNAERSDSLLSDLKRTQPRLRDRVPGVRLQYRHLLDAIGSLRGELAESKDPTPGVADIWERVAWLLTALRHQRARESDLIYEAYFDAFHADLGGAERL